MDAPMRERIAAADEVLERFTVLRESVKRGLRRVMEIDHEHPHYIAAVIMAVGCEAVGHLLSAADGERRHESDIFVNDLVLRYLPVAGEPARAMGRDLFDSIRNGIAHRFDPKPIALKDGRTLDVLVNWGEGLPHWGLCQEPLSICLNLFQMKRDFEAMLDRYRDELRATSRPGRRLARGWYWKETSNESDPGWRRFLGEPGA